MSPASDTRYSGNRKRRATGKEAADMNMNFHALRMMADRKIAEDREWAARCRLASEADRARREARHPAGSPLAGLLRTLASALGFSRPVLPVTVQEPRAE